MPDEKKPAAKPEDMTPSDATPHNPGLSPKPSDPSGATSPADKTPYEKKSDPARQPS